jgi:hypothetical protein
MDGWLDGWDWWMDKILLSKALPGFFPLNFQLPYLSEETCFHQVGCSAVEGTSQAVLGSFGQRKVPASLSLFRKKWENPSSALRRIRTCAQAPSLILSSYLCSYLDRRWWMRLITLFPSLLIIPCMLVLPFL